MEKVQFRTAERTELKPIRRNGRWVVHTPRFVKKEAERITWASRLEIEATALKVEVEPWVAESEGPSVQSEAATLQSLPGHYGMTTGLSSPGPLPFKTIVTDRGLDSYEVLWTTELTPTGD